MKSPDKLSITPVIILSLLFSGICSAGIVTAEDINQLSRQAEQIYNEFMNESFDERMQYIFFGNLPLETEKQKISEKGKQGSTQLSQIINPQKKLRTEIENYEGADWDRLYGANGLWRKLVCDICRSTTFKLEIDYYRYLFSPKAEKTQIYRQLKDNLEKHCECESNYHKFLKARFNFLLDNRKQALEILDELINSQDTSKAVHQRAKLSKLKHTVTSEPPLKKEINKITEEILNANLSGDTELVISLLAQQKECKGEVEFKKTLDRFDETEKYLCSLAARRVSKLYKNQKSNKITPLDVKLACLAALEGANELNKQTILNLAEEEKLKCPLLLYCCSESTMSENRAVEYLLECTRLKRSQSSSWLDIEASTLIRQAVERAYNGLVEKKVNCDTGREAFSSFLEDCPADKTYDLKFKAGCGLLFCGFEEEGGKTLGKLWENKNAGIWRYRARFNLLKHKASALSPADSDYENLLSETGNLIEQCSLHSEGEYRKLLGECINFHCGLLAAKGGKDCGKEILKKLSILESLNNKQIILKAHALTTLERYPKCLETLTRINKPKCENLQNAFTPLSEVIQRIEISEEKRIVKSQRRKKLLSLTETLQSCLENRQVTLLFAESLVSFSNEQVDIKKARQLLDNFDNGDPGVLRFRGKLLMAEGDFKAAAEKWVTIRNNIKNAYPDNYKGNWFWWQSRFYEFLCWSKLPDSSAKEIARLMEVLENSTSEIPFPWERKLSDLKKKLKTEITTN